MTDPTSTERKAIVRAWLFTLLAKLETAADVDGRKSEGDKDHVTIELQFKE